MPALALLSGGLDSTVAATYSARHGGLALALTIDYDQRSARCEIEAAKKIAHYLNAEHRVVGVPFLKELTDSSLTRKEKAIPKATISNLDHRESAEFRAKEVWLPNRNGLFINIAACFAQSLELETIVVGFNREEANTFPDNRMEFLHASSEALSYTLDKAVRVESPTAKLDKTEIVELALRLKAPLESIWSCYEAGPGHCFQCESCRRLERALRAAGIWDKLSERLKRS